jgi:hypothetical protein
MDLMHETDSLVKGAVLGLVSTTVAVSVIYFVIEKLTQLQATGWLILVLALSLMIVALIAPAVVNLVKGGSRTDIAFDPAAVKAGLRGRAIGIALGLAFGISVVTLWA